MKAYLSNLDITIKQLIDDINETQAKTFFQCTIEDILPDVSKTDGVGLYLFYEGDSLEYLGKTGGRNVLERLGGHIDHRENGIMNYYLRMMAVKRTGAWENHKSWGVNFYSPELRRTALNEVRDSLKEKTIKIIYVSDQFRSYCLDELETVLTAFLKPKFQKYTNVKKEWETKTIAELHGVWRTKKEENIAKKKIRKEEKAKNRDND